MLASWGDACGHDTEFITSPVRNNGKKWRIGYYEGGPYCNYPGYLREIVCGLMESGWAETMDIPAFDSPDDSRAMWQWFTRNIRSDYIEFVPDAYWSADWNRKSRKEIRKKIIRRLEKRDLDFMLAMGTWAGQDLAGNRHSVPTMVVSAGDPVRAGIISSPQDSGFDHIHAICDPHRYINQLHFFHNMVGFKRLGVVFENSVEGRTRAGLEDIRRVAQERNFSIVPCEAPASDLTSRQAAEHVARCHDELAHRIDALYVTEHIGAMPQFMPRILEPLLRHRIPTFSMRGSEEVRRGVLFSISRKDFKEAGRFHAKVMATVFNGVCPRNITQVFIDPVKISVNLKTAEIIGFDIPGTILNAADEIYRTIDQ